MEIVVRKRENWIDYAKFIGIVLVVLGHTLIRNNRELAEWIYSFHMPLFFILAGFFVKDDETLRDTLRRSFRMLIIPYIAFYIIAYIPEVLLVFIKEPCSLTVKGNIIYPMMGLLLGEGYSTSFSENINVPTWFLMSLFFCRVFFQAAITKGANICTCLILLNTSSILAVLILKYLSINLYWSIDSALLAIPFYSFGYLFKRHDSNHHLSLTKMIFVLFICLAISIIGFRLNLGENAFVDMSSISYGSNLIAFYLVGVGGSLAVVYISKIFSSKENKPISYLGKNTIVILGTHSFIIHYLFPFMVKLREYLSWDPSPLLNSIIITVLVMFFSFIPIYLINNYFPFIIGKTKKIKTY